MSNFLDDLLDERTANKWIDQNSPEWNSIRCGRFTSSEIYRLMEPSKREMTPDELKNRPKSGKGSSAKLIYDYSKLSDAAMTYVYEKVAEILTGVCRDSGYSYAVYWGKDHEDEAAEFFATKTGSAVEKVGFFKFTDHAGGSPDRFVNDDDILEIKCPYDPVNQINYLMLSDEFDVRRNYFSYWAQCQANLLFTDKKVCHFVTYDPRMVNDKHKMTHIKINPDREFRALLIQQIGRATKEKLEILNLLR